MARRGRGRRALVTDMHTAADANVAKHLECLTIRRVIHVKDKRLNLLVG